MWSGVVWCGVMWRGVFYHCQIPVLLCAYFTIISRPWEKQLQQSKERNGNPSLQISFTWRVETPHDNVDRSQVDVVGHSSTVIDVRC